MTAAQQVFAWIVHFYTAMGLVVAAGIAVLIVRGGDESFRWAFLLMMAATAIDATDGWLARKARVKHVLPGFDGAALDNLIDFHTYTSLPLLLLWRAGILPGHFAWLLLVPLLSSGYGFSQVGAKTDDGFFLGFPSYWNLVALYLFCLGFQPIVNALVLAILGVMVFVPIKYIYPNRTELMRPQWVFGSRSYGLHPDGKVAMVSLRRGMVMSAISGASEPDNRSRPTCP